MRAQAVLTVSESKRLIAKGVANMPEVRTALESRLLAIGSGSTNSYVVEEILGKPIDKWSYLTGITVPKKAGNPKPKGTKLQDIVILRNGKPATDVTQENLADSLREGDVFIKGCNMLHYESRTAGILVGHPLGGTIGSIWGAIIGRKAHLVLPVGLEKQVTAPIHEIHEITGGEDKIEGEYYRFMPVSGLIVTEIEALEILYDVAAIPVGAGGICGAEGSVRLEILGEPDDVREALIGIEEIQGEPPFGQ